MLCCHHPLRDRRGVPLTGLNLGIVRSPTAPRVGYMNAGPMGLSWVCQEQRYPQGHFYLVFGELYNSENPGQTGRILV